MTRTIGAEAGAPIAVLWTYWSAISAVLVFPLQHWIVQRTHAEGGEENLRGSLYQVALLVGLIALGASAAAWSLREVVFGEDGTVFALTIGAVTVGSGFVGIVRGRLAADRRFTAAATAIVGENGLRVMAAAAVSIANPSAEGYAVALATGPLIGLLWPSTWRDLLRARSTGHAPSRIGFLGSIAGGSLIAQLVLTSGPVVLALSGGNPAQVTSLFAALALYRAPYLVALGVVTQLTGYLTNLVIADREQILRRIRRLVAVLTVALGALAGIVARSIGPTVLTVVFGRDIELPPFAHAWIAVGTGLALGNLIITLMLVARGSAGRVALIWAFGVVAAAVSLVAIPVALSAVIAAFVVAQLAVFVGLLAADLHRSSSHAYLSVRHDGFGGLAIGSGHGPRHPDGG